MAGRDEYVSENRLVDRADKAIANAKSAKVSTKLADEPSPDIPLYSVPDISPQQKAANTRKELEQQIEENSGVSTKYRKRLQQEKKNSILEAGSYQAIVEGLEDMPGNEILSHISRQISFGANFGDIKDYIDGMSGKGYLWKYVAGKGKKGIPWDSVAQEISEITGREITDPREFIEVLDEAIQKNKESGGINEDAVDMAIASGDVDLVMDYMSYDMLRQGFSIEEINEAIEKEVAGYNSIGYDLDVADFKLLSENEAQNDQKSGRIPEKIQGAERKGQEKTGSEQEKRAQEQTRKVRDRDLLGRPELQGGAAGKQTEMFEKEDFKTYDTIKGDAAKKDVEGQAKLFEEDNLNKAGEDASSWQWQENAGKSGVARADDNSADPMIFGLRELVQLAKRLNEGKVPEVKKRLGEALGRFRHNALGEGKILLRADIFKGPVIKSGLVKVKDADAAIDQVMAEILAETEIAFEDIIVDKEKIRGKNRIRITFYKRDPDYATRTLAHEIGHLADWLDNKLFGIKRGNILGHIAALNKYVKSMIEGSANSQAQLLTKEDRQNIRNKAAKRARAAAGRGNKKQAQKLTSKFYKEMIEAEAQSRGLVTDDAVKNELKALGMWWKPYDPEADPTYTSYRNKPKELYADAVSVLLNNPAALRKRAPKFYQLFFGYMDQRPEVRDTYNSLSDRIRSGDFEKDAVERLRAGFREGSEKHVDIEKKKGLKKSDISNTLVVGLFDKAAPIKRQARELRKSGKLTAAQDPTHDINSAVYSSSRELYVDQISRRVIDPLIEAGLTWDDLNEYMYHLRVVNERNDKANPQGWNAPKSQQRIDEMKATMNIDALEKARKEFWNIRKEIVITLIKAEKPFTKDLTNKIVDNEFYATFDVVAYIDKAHGKGSGLKIFRQIGTLADITAPAEATMMKDLSLIVAVNWNTAKRQTIKLLSSTGEATAADKYWAGSRHEFKEPADKDQRLVLFMADGKMQGYYVDKWVAEAFNRENSEAMKVAAVIARAVGAPFRAVFTGLRPGFWAFNVIRDFRRSVKNLPKAKIRTFLPEYLKAVKPAFRSAFGVPLDVVEEMLKNNMLISVADISGLTNEDRMVDRLVAMYTKKGKRNWFKRQFHNFLRVGESLERIPKIAAYEYLKKHQPDLSEREIAHIIREQAGSPAFLTKGAFTPITNNLFLFSNAMIQGWRSDLEVLGERPGEITYKLAKYVGLPKLLLFALSSGLVAKLLIEAGADEDDKALRWAKAAEAMYANVSEYDKTNYIPVPLGVTPQGKTVYVRIPLDENERFFGGIFWKLLNMKETEIEGLQQILDYTASQTPSLNPALKVAQATKQYLAGINPYDYFRSRNVLPQTVFEAGGKEAHTAFAKWVANEFGASIVYRFRYDDPDRVKSELEMVLGLPVVGDIIGRFIRVSDYGKKEILQAEVAKERKARARQLLKLRKIASKSAAGQPLSDDEQFLADDNVDYIKRRTKLAEAKRGGDVYTNELLYARSKDERTAILHKIRDIEGDKFDILPYAKKDIITRAKTLSRVIPLKKTDRAKWFRERKDILKWYEDLGITPTQVWQIYRKEKRSVQATDRFLLQLNYWKRKAQKK